METKIKILLEIKNIIQRNNFLDNSLYKKIEKLDEKKIHKIFIILAVLDKERRDVWDDNVINEFLNLEKEKIEIIKSESTKFAKNKENSERIIELRDLDNLLLNL